MGLSLHTSKLQALKLFYLRLTLFRGMVRHQVLPKLYGPELGTVAHVYNGSTQEDC